MSIADEEIRQLLASERVVLFMKGVRTAPNCGFSAAVVEALDSWLDDYRTVDVLADEALRTAIKRFSDWPTIPQLYVDGEFIGGADIVAELERSGGLAEALGVADRELEAPTITITEAAAEQFRAAFASPEVVEDDQLRLAIDARFHNDLSIGPARPGDIEVEVSGLRLLLDRASARRARGLHIDFVSSEAGVGFKIDNPNAPPAVREISATELARRLAVAREANETLQLLDVRTLEEREQARIAGARLLDEAVADELEALDRSTPLYFHCHHGVRSLRAAQHFLELGFREVYNVAGGIDAWSQQVDPAVPRY